MKQLLTTLLVLWSTATMAGLPPTTTKGIGDSTDKATFKFQFPNMPISHTGVTAVLGGGLTTTQKLALTPSEGFQVFDTTLHAPSFYDGTSWVNGLGTISVDTDWVAFTPTSPNNSLTFSSTNCYWARSQSDMLIRCNFIPSAGASGASEAQIALPNNATTSSTLSTPTNAGTLAIGTNTASSYYILAKPSVAYIGIGVQNSGGHATVNLTGNTVADTNPMSMLARVPIQGWSSNGATYSSASANYDWTAYTPVTTGFGTITPSTNACMHRRVGGDLEVSCSFTEGTATATFGTIKLPNSLTIDSSRLSITNNTTAGQGSMVGNFSASGSNINGRMVTAPATDNTLVYISGNYNGTSTTVAQTTVLGGVGSSLAVNINFKVPITGWSNVSQVMANVAGYAQAPGVAGTSTPNVDHFSFGYGGASASTVCSAATCTLYNKIGTSAISGVASASSTYTLTTTKSYSALNCTVTPGASGVTNMAINNATLSCANCSTLSWNTVNGGGTNENSHGTVMCDGVW